MKKGLDIVEMAKEIQRQAEVKKDYLVNTERLEMIVPKEEAADKVVKSDVILRIRDHEDFTPVSVNSIAHRQIADKLNIPYKYYDRMLTEAPDLLTHNVNSWFQQYKPEQRMLRTLDGTARAFLSNHYNPIDNIEIAQAVFPILTQIEGARFESSQLTPSRMYIKVVNPRLETEVQKGDIVQAGVMISNSETGQGAVSIQPLVFRLVCLNGMVVNDAAVRRNHVGRAAGADENLELYRDETRQAIDTAFLMKIQDAVQAAVDESRFHKVVDMMREAAGAKMNTKDIPAVVEVAAKDYGFNKAEGGSILQHLLKAADYSLYGLANAVTRASQDVEDYDRATEFESIGYNILTMSPSRWTAYNNVA